MLEQYNYGLEAFEQDFRWTHQYCFEVLSGRIIACEYVKKACQRHIDDLSRDDIYFDEDAAQSVVNWFKLVPLTDSNSSGFTATKLLPWQIFVVCSLVAWKRVDETKPKSEWLRRYKYAYLQIARKAGKTTLAGGLILYFMYKSGYRRPRAYSVATKRDQAKEVWNTAVSMIKQSPVLKKIFFPRANDIQFPSQEGEFRPLASDSNSLDGLNPLIATMDECHAIKDRNLYGVMVSAFGMQAEGLMLTITTAGTVLDGICVDLNKSGKQVLDGAVDQDSYFYLIYEADKGDKWDDESTWYKANAGLAYGMPHLDYLKDQAVASSMTAELRVNFMTKHLNLFVTGYDKWLDSMELKECKFDLQLDDYLGKKCYIALDYARLHDLTSFCLLFPNEMGGADCFYLNLLPKVTYERASSFLKSVYSMAVEAGNLKLLDSPTVRNEHVKDEFRWINERFDVELYGYDPYKMSEIAQDLEEEGFPMVSVSQGMGNMSEPAKKLEALIKERTFRYNDRMLEYAASCAMCKTMDHGNIKIIRDNDKKDKIDPLISTIIALSCATLQKAEVNAYEQRGGFAYF